MKRVLFFVMALCLSASVFAIDYEPTWIREGMYDRTGEWTYFVGTANSGQRRMGLKKAESDARASAAQFVETQKSDTLVTYSNEAGEVGNMQFLEAAESLSIDVADAYLRGMERVDWYFNDGEYWVLMRIPTENLKEAVKSAINKVAERPEFRKDKAAQEANRLMAESLDRKFSVGIPSDDGDGEQTEMELESTESTKIKKKSFKDKIKEVF